MFIQQSSSTREWLVAIFSIAISIIVLAAAIGAAYQILAYLTPLK